MASEPYKVWTADRSTRKSLVAKTLSEVLEKGKVNQTRKTVVVSNLNSDIDLDVVKYSINTYVRYLIYALLVIAELPNDELTGNHTQPATPMLVT